MTVARMPTSQKGILLMNNYYVRKEARIQAAMDTLTIDTDIFGTFALVPSTSNTLDVYCVTINETGKVPFAEHCTCPGNAEHGRYCVHMASVDRLLQRVSMYLFHLERPYEAA